jgi:hypothetical protein
MSVHQVRGELDAMAAVAKEHVHELCVRTAMCCQVNAQLAYSVINAVVAPLNLPVAEVRR